MNTVSEADKADMKTEFELDILLRAERRFSAYMSAGIRSWNTRLRFLH